MGIIRILSIILILSVCMPAYAKWSHKEEIDPNSNDTNYFLYSVSSKGKNHFKNPVGLIMRCKNDRLILYVNWGVRLDGKKQVNVRFDDNEIIEQKWTSSSDKTALFHPAPKQMFQQMMAAKELEIETKTDKNTAVSAIFSLTDLSLASHKMRRNCNTKPE